MQVSDFIKEMCGVANLIPEGEAPTSEQWKRILDMLGAAAGALTTQEFKRQNELEALREQYERHNMYKAYTTAVTSAAQQTPTYSNMGIGQIIYSNNPATVVHIPIKKP